MNLVQLVFGNWYDEAYLDGVKLDPAPSQKLFNHSPDGFAWGYGGSGPAQLALAILLAAGLDNARAVRLHQAFKFEFIAPLGDLRSETFTVDIETWAREQDAPL